MTERPVVSIPSCSSSIRRLSRTYYRARSAHLLETELGLSLIRKGDSFEVSGVPEGLIQTHSARRAQIVEYLKKNGQHGAVAAAEAALKTRRTKKDVPPRRTFPAMAEPSTLRTALRRQLPPRCLGPSLAIWPVTCLWRSLGTRSHGPPVQSLLPEGILCLKCS